MNNDQLYFPKNFCTPCMFKTNSVYITIFQSISGTFPLISILTTYLLRSDWHALKTYISQIELSNMIKRGLQNIDGYVRNLHRLSFQ